MRGWRRKRGRIRSIQEHRTSSDMTGLSNGDATRHSQRKRKNPVGEMECKVRKLDQVSGRKTFAFTEDTIAVDLIDGRTIIVPLAWYPRLFNATPEQRRNWRISGAGYGIHWPDLDEDLSTEGLLRGAPGAPERAVVGLNP